MAGNNYKFAVYKIFNGTTFDTIYFKAPASAITESLDQQFISSEHKRLITTYLDDGFNVAEGLVQLNDKGFIPSDLIYESFGNYLDKRSTASTQTVSSRVEFTVPQGIDVYGGINLYPTQGDVDNSIFAISDGGMRLRVGRDANNQEITFLKDGNLVFKKATEIKNVKLGADSSAVPKSYVDTVIESGAKPIEMVKAATHDPLPTTPQTLTPTIDGVSVGVGDRVLLLGQSKASDNGVYIVSSGDWSKESNSKGALVFVEEGNTYNDSKWFHEGDGEWFKFSQTDQLQFSGGLTRSADNVSLATHGINDDHISMSAAIQLAKLGKHSGSIVSWGTRSIPNIQTERTLDARLTDLAAAIWKIRGLGDDSNNLNGDYGVWDSNSLSIKKVNDTAVAKQNPVRYGNELPAGSTALAKYKDGDIYLLLDK